jgi:hypothetical protein
MIPYFYKLKHKKTGKYYVGSQYGKTSNPDNLWVNYFTSSKIVNSLINEDGKESFDIVEVKPRSDAREYEQRYLLKAYYLLGRERFVELFLNRNLSPGILLTEEIIQKANKKRKISNSISAKKLMEEGRHNFQLNHSSNFPHVKDLCSERMRGNNYGSKRKMTTELKNKLAEKSKGNTNVRGTKWWYNTITKEKRRCLETPGEEWINKCPISLTKESREKISKANSKTKTPEHIKKLKIAAKNRSSNSKGTIWVKDNEGKRKRVKPENIPEGYKKV